MALFTGVKVFPYQSRPVTRDMFPKDFTFGTSTAAYQVEGAAIEDGKGKSIWDIFASQPGHVKGNDTGDVACDQYHRYEEDIQIMKSYGMDAYRFSIAWPRIFPDGRGKLNPAGVAYYNRLIDNLLANGLVPWATIYHWDLPQVLHEEYGGFLSDKIVADFVAYAEACFEAFGDRVKHWITVNEPYIFSSMGYGAGLTAPGLRDPAHGTYIAGHNIIKCHAATVHLYRSKYQSAQGGKIGLTIDANWAEPASDNPADVAAALRANEFHLAWIWDPIFFGRYPPSMVKNVGERLPMFTPQEAALLKSAGTDFIGINHYTSKWITAGEAPKDPLDTDFVRDQHCIYSAFKDDVAIGLPGASFWHYVVPWGMRSILNWLYNRYNVPICVTECGVDEHDRPDLPLEMKLNDQFRLKFHNDYVYNVAMAIKDGSDIKAYFVWSFQDNYEWAMGYSLRFGITYVDYEDNLKRYPKASARWWTEFNKGKGDSLPLW